MNGTETNTIIRKFDPIYVKQVAKLHIHGISTGFISSLGIDFVTALYKVIAEDKNSFGFVAVENEEVLGFISFTTNLKSLYKTVIVKKGFRFVFLLAGKIFSPKLVKKIIETLFYPNRIKKMNLPSAELLSIVVSPSGRQKGLAKQLVQNGFQECLQKGINKVKVLVGADNRPANNLYLKCGFEPAGQIENHGVKSNIYIAKTNK
ncbi:MAG: GNAT family N-acetyltransferase [Planctomycetes bacterium]|nr:GNAT family N-acetyltransferase [Planctomycetota bacterium]